MSCFNPLAEAATVTQQFQQAQLSFQKKRYGRSAKILKGILKKYPDHQPSRLLMGRIYYRSGKYRTAAKQFRRVPSNLVYGDTAYEYAITLFMAKDCKRALQGFARVPRDSKLLPLSLFYTGVCHMRGQRYFKAQMALQKAQPLPRNLASTRIKLLNQARRNVEDERKGRIRAPAPYVLVPPPPTYYLPVPVPPAEGGVEGKVKEAEVKVEPKSGWSYAVTPSLTIDQTHKTQTYMRKKEENQDTNSVELKLSSVTRYDAQPWSDGQQPSFSLNLDFAQNKESTKGSETVFEITAGESASIEEKVSASPESSETVGILTAKPEASIPLGPLSVTGSYEFLENYPDMKADGSSGTRSMIAGVSGTLLTLDLSAEGKFVDSVSQTSGLVKQTSVYKGRISKVIAETVTIALFGEMTQSTPALARVDLLGCDAKTMRECGILTYGGDLTKTWESFNINLGAKQMLYMPPSGEYRPGEAGSMSFNLGATITFDFGGSVSVNAENIQLVDYRKEIDAPSEASALVQDSIEPSSAKVIAQATGQAQKMSASFSLSPLDWLTGKVSFEQYSANFGVSDPNHAKAFEEKTVMDRQTFSLQVAVSKSF